MFSFRLRQFFTLLGVLALSGLLTAAIAAGTCGGEEEEAGVELKPAELVFTAEGQKKTVTITNLGSKSVELVDFTVGGSKAFKLSKTCEGEKLESKGASCIETVECVTAKNNAYFTIQTKPPVTANATLLKC
jgi:hypothetical protein